MSTLAMPFDPLRRLDYLCCRLNINFYSVRKSVYFRNHFLKVMILLIVHGLGRMFYRKRDFPSRRKSFAMGTIEIFVFERLT